MRSSRTLVSLSLLAAAGATKIAWGPCKAGEYNTTLPIECGTHRVPLDYTSPDANKTIDLQIVKIPALIRPSRGSIQFNFGGPGLPARTDLVALGAVLQQLSGGAYDLLAFDPRGTGNTIPFICAENPFYVGQITNEIRSGQDSNTALRRLWARGKIDANICRNFGNANETGEYIGTAFTARDFMSVVDALGEDGLLRYWGFSYGTTLGATLAAMFPDRIDKMIIDGVQNPHDYYHSHADFEEWADTDLVFSHFFDSCVKAGPEKCALAALNKTAAELEKDTYAFFDAVRAAPLVAGTFLVDPLTVKGVIMGALKTVPAWPSTAKLLAVIVYGTAEVRDALLNTLDLEEVSGYAVDSLGPVNGLMGIHCSDRIVRAATFEEVAPAFALLEEVSKSQGDTFQWLTAHCAQWPWHAKETYAGDFRVKTRNPILIAGNTRDAHTPIRSAHNISSSLEGSAILEVNGTGHTTINAPSVCSFRAHVAYWLNGTLPKPGFVCDAATAFEKYTWANVIQEITGVNATLAKREEYSRFLS